jgi:hypothetical protein
VLFGDNPTTFLSSWTDSFVSLCLVTMRVSSWSTTWSVVVAFFVETTMTSFFSPSRFAMADVVLSEKMVHLAMLSAQLSSLAYEEDPSSEGYDLFEFFDEGKENQSFSHPSLGNAHNPNSFCLV